jgi:hypothetical protein
MYWSHFKWVSNEHDRFPGDKLIEMLVSYDSNGVFTIWEMRKYD